MPYVSESIGNVQLASGGARVYYELMTTAEGKAECRVDPGAPARATRESG